MVFKGQDAWRKHPLLTGCHKVPFPHFGLAVKIFAGFLILEAYVNFIHAPPEPAFKPNKKYMRPYQKEFKNIQLRPEAIDN